MPNATLPEDMEDPTLDCMSTGEVAYTVPWAMWVDAERRCWLNPKYRAQGKPTGTVKMRVELREDGYHVWRVAGHGYSPSTDPGYFGASSDAEYLPVVEIHS